MQAQQDLLYDERDGVAHIVLNKPEKKNALNPDMRNALWDALGKASASTQVRAVDGCAYGIGFSLALAADIVVATPRSRFCLSFMRLGLVPDGLALFTLPRIIGWARAKKMLYSAQEIDGRTAAEDGIVTELVEPDALLERARAIANALASSSPAAFALTKNALLRSFSSDASAVMDMDINGQGIAYSTSYHKDAVKAFMGKQPLAFAWPAKG